jgi:membrane associated rhomboid family serine protease
VTDTATPAGVCYRHPKRESWVLCQRCGRTICPACQTQAAVGVQCPECVREGHASIPRRRRNLLRAFAPSGSKPVVTYALIGVTLFVYLLQYLTRGAVTGFGVYVPILTEVQPWRLVTSVFLHAEFPLHIAFNMLTLYLVGQGLEPILGRVRFLALYLISGFAGSVGVLVLADPRTAVIGASGAVFGLFGAYLIIGRRLGANVTTLVVIVAANLLVGFFFFSNVSWQAHVGGLAGGALVALVYVATRHRRQRWLQVGLTAALVLALVAVTVVAYQLRIAPFFG